MPLSEQAERRKDRRTGTRAAPQLQHRHFAFIAACLASIPNKVSRLEACQSFINQLYRSNPGFNISRFRDACNCDAGEWTRQELEA